MLYTLTFIYIQPYNDIDKYLYYGYGLFDRGVIFLDINYKEYAVMMKALSDETRVKIYSMLSKGELCACKILEEFNITQPTLSYHMKFMCDSGLINSRRDGVWMKYSINRDKLQKIIGLLNDINVKAESSNCSEENC